MLYVILKCLEDLNRKSMEMTEYRNKTSKFDLAQPPKTLPPCSSVAGVPAQPAQHFQAFQDMCQALWSIKSPGRTRNLKTHTHTQFQTFFGQVRKQASRIDSEWIQCSMYDQSSSMVRRNWPCSTHLNDEWTWLFDHQFAALQMIVSKSAWPRLNPNVWSIHYYTWNSSFFTIQVLRIHYHQYISPCGIWGSKQKTLESNTRIACSTLDSSSPRRSWLLRHVFLFHQSHIYSLLSTNIKTITWFVNSFGNSIIFDLCTTAVHIIKNIYIYIYNIY